MDGFNYFGCERVGEDDGDTLYHPRHRQLLRAIVGEDVPGTVIPKVGANYDDDAKTVTAVQYQLKYKYGYDLGKGGLNDDGVDGLYGSHTKNAVKKLQKSLGYDQTGIIDENVVRAMNVTPGKLPPGVSAQANAAVQAQAQLEIATAAEHASTPSDVQAVAQQAQTAADNAAPPLPPEVKQKVAAAVAQAKAAKTPAEVQDAKSKLVDATNDAHAAVKPHWYSVPAWDGGPSRLVAGAGGVGIAAALAGVAALVFGK